jgi:hypothetical protein
VVAGCLVGRVHCQLGDEAMMTPPSKNLCLMMAKVNFTRDEKLSWTWLVAWAFHEMYVEGWYQEWKP